MAALGVYYGTQHRKGHDWAEFRLQIRLGLGLLRRVRFSNTVYPFESETLSGGTEDWRLRTLLGANIRRS